MRSALFRSLFLCNAVAALTSVHIAMAGPPPEGDLLIAVRSTDLLRFEGGRWSVCRNLPRGTLLRLDRAIAGVIPDASNGGFCEHVCVVGAHGAPQGWVHNGQVLNLSRMNRDGREPDPDDLPAWPDERSRLPALIARQNKSIRQAWVELESIIRENEMRARKARVPDPYFAKAELWRLVGNNDDSLREYLRGSELVVERGHDLVDHSRYFIKLERTLREIDERPRPAYAGEAADNYGRGLHAFNDGRQESALAYFNDAVQLDPLKPEYWYFRALTHRLMGEGRRAEHDALMGSDLERRINRGQRDPYIGAQLVKVQGESRSWLESYRNGDVQSRLGGR